MASAARWQRQRRPAPPPHPPPRLCAPQRHPVSDGNDDEGAVAAGRTSRAPPHTPPAPPTNIHLHTAHTHHPNVRRVSRVWESRVGGWGGAWGVCGWCLPPAPRCRTQATGGSWLRRPRRGRTKGAPPPASPRPPPGAHATGVWAEWGGRGAWGNRGCASHRPPPCWACGAGGEGEIATVIENFL